MFNKVDTIYVKFVTEVPFSRNTLGLRCTAISPTSGLSGRRAVVDQRKQAVSIRLGESDIRNIKRIAKRLGVRDSDIIRFALKATLSRIAPLCDPAIRGRTWCRSWWNQAMN